MTDQFKGLRNELYDTIIEQQRATYRNPLESFEVHSARIKEQMHASTDEYLERLQHGYDVILQKVASKMQRIN